jgi:hypothetical protein
MKTSTALFACLPASEIQTMIDAGALGRSDVAAINLLRASGVSKRRLLAKAQSAPATEIEKDATPMTTADDILAERVAKAAHIQKGLREAIRDVQTAHPGISRRDAIDKVLFGPGVREMVRLDKQIDQVVKLGGGNLPTPRPGTMHRTHNDSAPVRGRTGYDSSVDGRPPHNPDASEEPTIHDHNEMLAQIRSGQIPFSDPRVSALVRLERKAKFGS